MIQFNLLPDVKLDYIKAQRSARLVMSVSILISAATIASLVLLLSVNALQRKHLSDLSRDIKSESAQLQSEPQINKVLTVQNQLESLTSLHNQKPDASRLFTYLNQLTPSQVSITNLHVDFNVHSVTVTGTADALSTVNKFVDTLKFTDYMASTANSSTHGPITNSGNKTASFSNVVLSSFGLNNGQSGNAQASYTISFSYDPTIFDNTQTVNLSIPSLTTTRSSLDQPNNDLFTAAPSSSKTGGQ